MKNEAIEKNIFYVYAYLDPRKLGDYSYDNFGFEYEPFYIGKGKKDRYRNLLKTYRKTYENRHLKNRIDSIRKEEKKPIVTKVLDCLFEFESFAVEMTLIDGFGRRDLGTGTLCNLTNGGDGCSGRIVTKEQIERQKKNWVSPYKGKKIEEIVGEKRGTELRKQASDRMKKNNPMKKEENKRYGKENVMSNPNVKKRHGKVVTSEEFRRKQSDAKKGEKNPNYGKIFGDDNPARRPEVRAKLRMASAGKNNGMYGKPNPRAREVAMMKRKEYIIISPENIGVMTKDLRGFCKKYDLSKSGMNAVANGYYTQHRGGWICLKTEDVLIH